VRLGSYANMHVCGYVARSDMVLGHVAWSFTSLDALHWVVVFMMHPMPLGIEYRSHGFADIPSSRV